MFLPLPLTPQEEEGEEKAHPLPAAEPIEDESIAFENPMYETVDFDKDLVPEKTLPSPEDFEPPDKPLQTMTTTATPAGEYKAAPQVAKDDNDEPRYATVLPKSKRATARPFAADEDSDEETV